MKLSRLGRPLLILLLCVTPALTMSSCAHGGKKGGGGGGGGDKPKPKGAGGPKSGGGKRGPKEGVPPAKNPFGNRRDRDPHFRQECDANTPNPRFGTCGLGGGVPPTVLRERMLEFFEYVQWRAEARGSLTSLVYHPGEFPGLWRLVDHAAPPSEFGHETGMSLRARARQGKADFRCFTEANASANLRKVPGAETNPVLRDLAEHMNPAASGEMERRGRPFRTSDPGQLALATSSSIHDWFDCHRSGDEAGREGVYFDNGQVALLKDPGIALRAAAVDSLPAELTTAPLRRLMKGNPPQKQRLIDLWREWVDSTNALRAEVAQGRRGARSEFMMRAVQGMFFTMASLELLKSANPALLPADEIERYRNSWIVNTERMMGALRDARQVGFDGVTEVQSLLDKFRNPSVDESSQMNVFRRSVNDTFPNVGNMLNLSPETIASHRPSPV